MLNTGSVTRMKETDIILHAFLLQKLEVGLFYISKFIKTITFSHKAALIIAVYVSVLFDKPY